LDRTLDWPYSDPNNIDLERGVVLGANLIAYRSRPYHKFWLATDDGSELPENLKNLATFTPFNLPLTITGVNP
jgi:hypothetical protein